MTRPATSKSAVQALWPIDILCVYSPAFCPLDAHPTTRCPNHLLCLCTGTVGCQNVPDPVATPLPPEMMRDVSTSSPDRPFTISTSDSSCMQEQRTLRMTPRKDCPAETWPAC